MGIPEERLNNQLISSRRFTKTTDVVAWLGALQAQDYGSIKWSLGLRLPGTTEADIDKVIADASIVRTWPMRNTLHFVPSVDVHWMLRLLNARSMPAMLRRDASLGITTDELRKAEKAVTSLLAEQKLLSRDKAYRLLESVGVSTSGNRGYHILCRLGHEGIICFGPLINGQPTIAILDDWCKNPRRLSRDESLAELAKRFFQSHGPATADDFIRWTGLTSADTKHAISLASTLLNPSSAVNRINSEFLSTTSRSAG